MKNILIAMSGPSGVGKGTLVKRLVEHHSNIVTSVSCTTRAPREGETDKKDYFFITRQEFEDKIKEDGFLEYDEHFGNYYGTPKSFIDETLKSKSVILEIDVNGALNAKRRIPDTVLIMIAPPSKEEVYRRLKNRGTESEEQIQGRIARMEFELSFQNQYDYVVINDDLDRAEQEIMTIIDKEKAKL